MKLGEPKLYSCSFYTRASSIVLLSVFLGACSTANGLDTIAADISKPDPVNVSGETKPTTEDLATDTPALASPVAIAVASDKTLVETTLVKTVAISEAPAAAIVASEQPVDEPDIPVNAYANPKQPPALASTSFESNGAVSKVQANSPELHALIARYSSQYEVPERLVHRVVKRESNYDPTARHKVYWGLMQIRHDTAQTMGYRGPASGLLDAETNLKYAVKYLRGAYLTANSNEDQAVRFYARGYYYDAKRKGLLKVTGLRP